MMNRKTKIVCTLGPASSRRETIRKMVLEGMDVARINFSHGDHTQHAELISAVRSVNATRRHKIKILQDLEGYRIRVGELKRPLELMRHQEFWMSNDAMAQAPVPLDAAIDMRAIRRGMDVFIDDGKIHLKVIAVSSRAFKLEVLQGGSLKPRKGINIPQYRLKADTLTAKDLEDIEFGIRHKMDFVAQSFVRNRQDIQRVVDIVRPVLPGCRIIAKIENQDGVKNLDSIMKACDGVMVARGDLGVSFPIYQIPMIQKMMIRRCNRQRKIVMTATQMLESMTENARPTRAEVSDVANAILDGTDYVMLSGETAAGAFPVKSVRMMRQVIEFTEQSIRKKMV